MDDDDDINVTDELGNNPLHIDLYQRALSRGFETDNTIRVNVVGNFAQGKTSLTQSLVGKTCQTVQSTNGIEINHCKYFKVTGDVTLFQTSTPDEMDIIDRIAEVAKNEKENVNGESNTTEPTENTERSSELQEFASQSGNKEVIDSASIFLCTKTQAESTDNTRQNAKSSLTPKEVQKFSTLLTLKQFERDVEGNFEIWDFAGQFVFYATHTIFHSNRAVYLLVFDLSKPLSMVVLDTEYPMETGDKTMEHFIKFWMNSIHSYVGSNDGSNPPVILVGTHKDKLDGTENEKNQYAEEYFEKIRTFFENTPVLNHIHTKDFVVNSTDPDDKEIEELRKEIIHIREHSKLKVPARWIALEKELVQIRYKKIIPFSKVVEIDSQNEFPLKEEEEIKLFLLYHHRKGTLFFFDEEPISRYVVLDTQFLIDAFRCIVTSERFCRKEPQYRSLWKLLQNEAKLTKELIEKCFDSNSELSKFKNEILMFMQRHYIISEVSGFDEKTGKCNPLGWYIVPIFLRNHSDNKTLKEFLTRKKQTSLRFLMAFQYSPVVQIVYCRLIAAMVARWPVVQIGVSKQRKEFMLYENLGVFRLDSQNAGAVELQKNRIEMRVISLCTFRNINNITADRFRRFAESVVISEFNKLRDSSTLEGKPFQTCFSCNNESHGLNGSQEVLQLENLKLKSIEPCLDMPVNHEIHAQQALSEWFEEISTIGLTEDCHFNEKQLSKIAQSIGNNWEHLGSELGLSIVEIDQLSMNHDTCSVRIYKMLLKWRAKQQKHATVNTLLQAMKSTKSLNVEWDDVMNIVEQIASTQIITHL
ncbi:uncharacterized protein LOC132743521 [Ruditapes philippinarum]|uniref:uncharacterized protein LOC132743521 n=1 Tax=Ruditapes philippinarum TaxID=129788 RepID=UPI00295A9454|nr:uncharacterized protein LOC132743521 [Ruditapes philippinarum]